MKENLQKAMQDMKEFREELEALLSRYLIDDESALIITPVLITQSIIFSYVSYNDKDNFKRAYLKLMGEIIDNMDLKAIEALNE